MKQAKLLVMGEKRLVYEDQVNNAMTAMMESGMAKNDRTLLKAIVEEWSTRNLEEPMFRGVPGLPAQVPLPHSIQPTRSELNPFPSPSTTQP